MCLDENITYRWGIILRTTKPPGWHFFCLSPADKNNEKLYIIYFFAIFSFLCQDKSVTEARVGPACSSPDGGRLGPGLSQRGTRIPGKKTTYLPEKTTFLPDDLDASHRPHTDARSINIWFPLCSSCCPSEPEPLVWLSVKAFRLAFLD